MLAGINAEMYNEETRTEDLVIYFLVDDITNMCKLMGIEEPKVKIWNEEKGINEEVDLDLFNQNAFIGQNFTTIIKDTYLNYSKIDEFILTIPYEEDEEGNVIRDDTRMNIINNYYNYCRTFNSKFTSYFLPSSEYLINGDENKNKGSLWNLESTKIEYLKTNNTL